MKYQVTAKNFQSWNELNFEFVDGVTLLKGFNYDDQTSEGSGKSAIPNALCWGLFGKVPEDDVKIDDIVKYGEKGCQVLVIVDDHTIYRSRGPNELKLIKHETNEVIKGKDARETQKLIEKFIGMSFETFCQTAYFPQGYAKKFVKASQEERGKVLSEIQDLSVFDRGYKEAHEMLKPEKKKLEDLKHQNELEGAKYNHNLRSIQDHKNFAEQERSRINAQIQTIENNLKNKESSKIDFEQRINNFTSLAPEQIDEYNNDITALEARVQELMGFKSKVDVQISEISNNANAKIRLQNNLNSDNSRIQKLSSERVQLVAFIANPTKTCNTCGSTLDKCDTSHAQTELKQIDSKIDDLQSGLAQMNTQLAGMETFDASELNQQVVKHNADIQQTNSIIYDLREKCKDNDKRKIEFDNLKNMLSMVDTDMVNIQAQLDQAKNQQIDTRNEVIHVLQAENTAIEETIESLNNLIDSTNIRMSQLENLKAGFKEVKSYTFTSVLNELTRRANDYLQDLFEVPMYLKFTNENMKIGLDISMNKIPRSYGLCSGGQQRRIGLAIDLALSDITTSRTGSKVNFLILDEYFKDLSESSMTKCLNLLEKLGKPIVLVEHNSIFNSIVNRTFDVELRDGTSCSMI